MSKLKKGLGRGFDSLIPTTLIEDEFDPTRKQDQAVSRLTEVPVTAVRPNPDQPRKEFLPAALEELAASIAEHGIVQPLIVVPEEGTATKYLLIAGERRWRAAQLAGLENVPVVIRTLSNQQQLEIALIENLQREDLNPLETATAYLKLHEQFNLSYSAIGRQLGKAPSTISNLLRLLALPHDAKIALAESKIVEGHARQILAIKEPEIQKELLELIIRNDWSVRKAEQFVIGYKEGGEKGKESAVAKTRAETPQTQRLGEHLGAKVAIRNMAKGGQLLITFKNDDDLERISQLVLKTENGSL